MLYDLIMLGIVVACLVAIHYAFDAMQRKNVKRWFVNLLIWIKKAFQTCTRSNSTDSAFRGF